jgi:hypothetical protein
VVVASGTKNLLLSFEILADAFRYLRLKSKHGLYPFPSGCSQNSFSSFDTLPVTGCSGNGAIKVFAILGSSSTFLGTTEEREVKSIDEMDIEGNEREDGEFREHGSES